MSPVNDRYFIKTGNAQGDAAQERRRDLMREQMSEKKDWGLGVMFLQFQRFAERRNAKISDLTGQGAGDLLKGYLEYVPILIARQYLALDGREASLRRAF